MLKTNNQGQKLYPFSSTEHAGKLAAMHGQICTRLQQIADGDPETYPGEQEILKNNKTELSELTNLCSRPGIIYLTGNVISRAKEWITRYENRKEDL